MRRLHSADDSNQIALDPIADFSLVRMGPKLLKNRHGKQLKSRRIEQFCWKSSELSNLSRIFTRIGYTAGVAGVTPVTTMDHSSRPVLVYPVPAASRVHSGDAFRIVQPVPRMTPGLVGPDVDLSSAPPRSAGLSVQCGRDTAAESDS